MTITFGKTLIACTALSAIAFASNAHAGNEFNKFPEQLSTTVTQGIHATTFAQVNTRKAKIVTRKRHIKRVVEPVPYSVPSRISYASDTGTSNLRSGFNKMDPQKHNTARVMPVLIDNRALIAR